MNDFKYTRPEPFPPIVKNIIIINILMFVAQLVFKQYNFTEKIMMWPLMPHQLHEQLVQVGYIGDSEKFQPYQVVTHMFAHAPDNFLHILFNMFMLWMFGRVLENVWGPKRFLIFYLACGIGAAAFHLGMQYIRCQQLLQDFDQHNVLAIAQHIGAASPALGASGAIMGVMVAFAFLFPNTQLIIMPIPIPVKAKWAITGFVALDLFGGFSQVGKDNIAHFAHLGGALTGFIIVYVWNKTNRKTLY